METCPNCGSDHIGFDVLYREGAAMFCQECKLYGPRVPLDPDYESWVFQAIQAEAATLWNEKARVERRQLPQVIHT